MHSVVKLFSVVLTLFTTQEACTHAGALIRRPARGRRETMLVNVAINDVAEEQTRERIYSK